MNEQTNERTDEGRHLDVMTRLYRDDLIQAPLFTNEGKEAQRGCARPLGELLVKARWILAVLDSSMHLWLEGCSPACGSGEGYKSLRSFFGFFPCFKDNLPEATVE